MAVYHPEEEKLSKQHGQHLSTNLRRDELGKVGISASQYENWELVVVILSLVTKMQR